jgi:3alpha(or 20beta)-hydroxysteroid dehydrogenase
MGNKLEGMVAVVTGAARGQGEATARLFAAEGARVAVVDVIEDAGRAVAEGIGGAASFHAIDVSKEPGWQALAADLMRRWGRIDVLVNNAAILHTAELLQLERTDFERVLSVNLLGAWAGIKTLAPQMIAQGKGSIVNVHSVAALVGINGLGAYVASKWALRGLTKTFAMELGHRGVRVNGIFPGGIDSPMAGVEGAPRREINKLFVGQPLARIGEPEEVARASLFLASDDASYLCGAELTIDGGLTLGKFYPDQPGAPAELVAASRRVL